jgi:hypothetical protein
MLTLHPPRGVIIGVDTHKDTHTAAAVGATGNVVEHLTVSADPAGYRRLVAFGRRHEARLWAIEGTGSFGAGLTTELLARGERIVEVDRPQRPARRGGVKSDDIDAVRAARQALAGVGLSEPRSRGEREAIRVLLPPAGRRSNAAQGPSRLCTRWSSAPPTVSGNGSEHCRSDSSCEPAPACGARCGTAWRSPPPCWLYGPPHAGRSPARRRPPSSRPNSPRSSARSPPTCSTSWESALSWPVRSSPPGPIRAVSAPRPPSPSWAVSRPSRRRRGRSSGTD